MSAGYRGKLVLDVRAFGPEFRRPLIFTVVDKLLELDSESELVIISDHDPSGIDYQIDLRRESRGQFEFSSELRSDGAWVALLRRKRS